MRILDRYVLKEMAFPLLFGIIAFTSLFVGVDLVKLVQTVTEHGASLGVAARLFALRLPQVVVWTFPMAVLLATLLSLSRLSANSEIVAMQAGGMSIYRIVAVVVGVGFVTTVLTVAISEGVVPAANFEYNRVMMEVVRGRRLPTVRNNVILTEYQGGKLKGFLHAARFDGERETMTDVTIVSLEDGRPVETTFAERLVWQDNAWFMEDGIVHRHASDDDGRVTTLVFRGSRRPVPVNYAPQDVVRAQRDPEEMTMAELRQHIRILRERGGDTLRHEVQYHLKTAIPAASIVFALIGAPLGIQSHRSATSVGFGLSIVLIFIYYVVMTVGTALGQGGHLPPLLAAWLQNLLLGALGIGLLIKAGRR